jgi:hypothetical protein
LSDKILKKEFVRDNCFSSEKDFVLRDLNSLSEKKLKIADAEIKPEQPVWFQHLVIVYQMIV